ncbi:MAG: hypothetical protein JOY71_02125, partial [Acetobacteraceae bacterium]|nr:hypothetical protein [Acetobacteraceae bacterium]
MPGGEGNTTQNLTIEGAASGIVQQAGHHNVAIGRATFQTFVGDAAPPAVAEPELTWLTLADAFQVDGIDL